MTRHDCDGPRPPDSPVTVSRAMRLILAEDVTTAFTRLSDDLEGCLACWYRITLVVVGMARTWPGLADDLTRWHLEMQFQDDPGTGDELAGG